MLKAFMVCLATGAVLSTGAIGCSKTSDATARREVSEDGRVATQTRERTRQTAAGATVRETEIQRREVISPGPTTVPTDARNRTGVGTPGSPPTPPPQPR